MDNTHAQQFAVRRAVAADAAALTSLRELMLSDIGVCDRHAPGPGNPGGVQGHVFNMSTDPRFRRRGYARACLDALLAWFREETEAKVVNLNATSDGTALYRELGFTEPRYPALQLRLARPGSLPAAAWRAFGPCRIFSGKGASWPEAEVAAAEELPPDAGTTRLSWQMSSC